MLCRCNSITNHHVYGLLLVRPVLHPTNDYIAATHNPQPYCVNSWDHTRGLNAPPDNLLACFAQIRQTRNSQRARDGLPNIRKRRASKTPQGRADTTRVPSRGFGYPQGQGSCGARPAQRSQGACTRTPLFGIKGEKWAYAGCFHAEAVQS